MLKLVNKFIELYQKTLSPDHGWLRFLYPNGYCQFYPSCSEYSREAIKCHGYFGLWLASKRILRCNPFSQGGVDKVPCHKN